MQAIEADGDTLLSSFGKQWKTYTKMSKVRPRVRTRLASISVRMLLCDAGLESLTFDNANNQPPPYLCSASTVSSTT